MVLDFLAVDNFDFTRKIVKKKFGEKLVKMLGFVEIEFLDKNLTFRIVCENAVVMYCLVIYFDFTKNLTEIQRGLLKNVQNCIFHHLLHLFCNLRKQTKSYRVAIYR